MLYRKMQQAMRIIGDIHSDSDANRYPERTFTSRRFFNMGNHAYTSIVHVRHLDLPVGQIMTGAQLQPLTRFICFLRTKSGHIRYDWLLAKSGTHLGVRTFRWASNDTNDAITIFVDGHRLVALIVKDIDVHRVVRWIKQHMEDSGDTRRIDHRILWY